MGARLVSLATVRPNHERFVREAVANETVWTVWGTSGPIVVDSRDERTATGEEPVLPRDVYLFFSDEEGAQHVLDEMWPDFPAYSPRRISLFDLLYRWLPGMFLDGPLAG